MYFLGRAGSQTLTCLPPENMAACTLGVMIRDLQASKQVPLVEPLEDCSYLGELPR